MDATYAITFARDWISAWRAENATSLVARFAPGFRFATSGSAPFETQDRAALHRYWRSACALRLARKYVLDHTVFDLDGAALSVYYAVGVAPFGHLAADHFGFDSLGLITNAEVRPPEPPASASRIIFRGY